MSLGRVYADPADRSTTDETRGAISRDPLPGRRAEPATM
jgi:hypothetical protein